MPKYAALIYGPAEAQGQATSEEWAQMMVDYNEFGEKAEAAGVMAGAEALEDTHTATTVRVEGGKGGEVVHTDGPYAEAKEVLAGSICSRARTSTRRSSGPPRYPAPGTARWRFAR